MNGNAMGRLDQYAWPYLEADLAAGRIDLARAAELTDCFCLKFNERAKTTEEQRPEAREPEPHRPGRRTRHYTSSQLGTERDCARRHQPLAAEHRRRRPDARTGADGTNPLTFLLLESYRRNQMTNPLLTVRVHRGLARRSCSATPARCSRTAAACPPSSTTRRSSPPWSASASPRPDARDYTNDGCWEVIIPGRTDFRFQRLSLMLCLEWALNRGRSRLDGCAAGPRHRRPARASPRYEEVWQAFLRAARRDGRAAWCSTWSTTLNDRSIIAPVPLLSALIDGCHRLSPRHDRRRREVPHLRHAGRGRGPRHRLADRDQDGDLRGAARRRWPSCATRWRPTSTGTSRLRQRLLAAPEVRQRRRDGRRRGPAT